MLFLILFFKYNPRKILHHNDDDESDMEAGFEDIMCEEKLKL